ncbi:MAG: M23 family metallopeptidase [Firmicutes bacterium]|nr:M23 family metallopeptidase [Bacillota bacterium]
MKKAIRRNKKKHITFLYIPENESSVKTLRLTSWIPKFAILTLAAILIYAGSYTVAYRNLKDKYEISLCSIQEITAINNSQRIEIERLEDNALEIQEQLCDNINALKEIKELVGINDDNAAPPNIQDKSSNTYQTIPFQPIVNTNNTNYTDHIFELKTSFVSLSKVAKSQKTLIEDSVAPIKDKVAYLKAKPSIKPVQGKITAGYGYRKNPFSGRGSEFHKGVDIATRTGTPVVATADGTVTYSGWKSGYGNMVIISHGYGFITVYAHNSKLLVKIGDKVNRGQQISRVGSTGRSTAPHLHYEIKLNGKNVDPARYF